MKIDIILLIFISIALVVILANTFYIIKLFRDIKTFLKYKIDNTCKCNDKHNSKIKLEE